jgi:branched-chain amino acid transport system ATP-binding protein
MTVLLGAEGLFAGYGNQPVVHGIDLEVRAGEVVALLGANGAGKTTTLLALSGDLAPLEGRVMFDGQPDNEPLFRRARRGLGFVTEEKSVFMRMSVAENLKVARCDERRVFDLFPELEPLQKRRAGLLSGGEQQMLTLARFLARSPRVLLADELSLGLGPLVVRRLLSAIRRAADEDGVGVLLVEQHVTHALEVSDRAYVMGQGKIVMSGESSTVASRIDEVRDSYLARATADAPVHEPPTA